MKYLPLTLFPFIVINSACTNVSGDGTSWSGTFVGTDLKDVDLGPNGFKAKEMNQSLTYAATIKAAKSAWTNYILAEGLKWVGNRYFDKQNLEISGKQAIELEKLRNAKSAADSAAALEELKIMEAAKLAE